MFSQQRVGFLMLTVLGSSVLAASAGANPSESLIVSVNGLKDTRGQVCLSLYANPQDFPMHPERSAQTQCVKITKIPMQITFRNLRPGNYAIAALHDSNGDREANRNFIGMPKEGFGFSRNPRVSTVAPKFEEASVRVNAPNTKISIQMTYLPTAR